MTLIRARTEFATGARGVLCPSHTSEPVTREGGKEPVEEGKRLPRRLVRNAGVFYVCRRLSLMGWDAMPATRYAKGPNVVIEREDAEKDAEIVLRLKVRNLSKRDPVPLGENPHVDADWVVVCTEVRTDNPRCFVMTPDEVVKFANRDKHGKNHWLEPAQYDSKEFAERWDRLGNGPEQRRAARKGAESGPPRPGSRGRGTEEASPPSDRQRASPGSAGYIWVHGGKLRPGMLVLDIRGNARDGSVPEGVGVVEEITDVTPASPSGGKEYVKLYLKEVVRGAERTRYACTTKLFLAKAKA